MKNTTIRNAIIKSARLLVDDHGILSAWLDLDYGGSGQRFGGYGLYLPKSFTHHNQAGPNYAGHFIWRCMEIAGVTDWSRMAGKTIRAEYADGPIIRIGHIINDDWFNCGEDFQKMTAEVKS